MTDHGSSPGDSGSGSLADWYRGVRSRASRTLENSILADVGTRGVDAGERVADICKGSWLYRWLTAEPEPEVIVIDLRETYTVGPFVRLLDRLFERADDWAESSRVAAAVRTAVHHVAASPLQVGGLLLVVASGTGLLASLASGGLSTPTGAVFGGALLAGLLATREQRSWEELRETRPVRLLAAAFEPPEPADSDQADERDSSR